MPDKPIKPSTISNYPLSDWLPDTFSQAQQVPIVQTRSLSDLQNGSNDPSILGQYTKQGANADAPYIQVRPPNQYPATYDTPAHVAAHEAGHAVWSQELTPQNREDWALIHLNLLKDRKKAVENFRTTNDPETLRGSRWPAFMELYPNDPGHSFADAFGVYASDPQKLKKRVSRSVQVSSGFNWIRVCRRKTTSDRL